MEFSMKILNLHQKHCVKCGKIYTNTQCKPCQTNYLKENFTNWTSGNEKIDNFIQEMQSEICHPTDIIFEWIPYNHFNNIKEIDEDYFASAYLAIWKDGPLHWNKVKYTRDSNRTVVLKFLCNS